MYLTVFFLLAGVLPASILISLHVYIWWTQDAAEPPILGNSIPFLSPIVGILRERTNYMVQIRNSHPDVSVYTLRLPGSRTYVINSPSLVPALQRQKRSIAFEPIPVQAAANIMGVSREGLEIIGRDCTGDHSYFSTFLRATHPALAPGAGLDAISRVAVGVLAASMDSLELLAGGGRASTCTGAGGGAAASRGGIEVDLWHWVRHEMLMATTEAIYGPGNPFRDAANEQAYYDFERGIMLQMLRIHRLFAHGRASLRARERLVRAFEHYFAAGHHTAQQQQQQHHSSSPNTTTTTADNDVDSLCLVRARHAHNAAHGLRAADAARTEIGQAAASLSNTIPGAFWLLWHVLSDAALLASCRREIERCCVTDGSGDDVDEQQVLDCARLADAAACPVTHAAWREALRFNHVGTAARVVMRDGGCRLGGFLLKKGGAVVVVSPVMHSDAAAWGASAGVFDHGRFLDGAGGKATATARPAAADRSFGGGSTLCPGRYLATRETLALLALTVLRFDVRPVGGRGWVAPKRGVPGPTSMPVPEEGEAGALRVEMVARFPGRKWRVLLRGSRSPEGGKDY